MMRPRSFPPPGILPRILLASLALVACQDQTPLQPDSSSQFSSAASDSVVGRIGPSSALSASRIALSSAATTSAIFEDALIAIVPGSETRVSNCIPFGNNTDFGFTGFIYRDVPAFELADGDELSFDLGASNGADIRRNIYLAVANKNPGPAEVEVNNVKSQGIRATAWVQVVTDTQTPSSRGNSVIGDYEVVYRAEQSFSFPGGGLIVGFGGSPPGSYADDGCEQVLVTTTSSDVSGHFYSRFFAKNDQTTSVLDDITIGGSAVELGGIVIRSTNRAPLAVAALVSAPPLVAGSALEFSAAGSGDPDGDPLTYAWDLDGDGVVDESTPSATFTYPVTGSYTATLTVSDGSLSSTASVPVEVTHNQVVIGVQGSSGMVHGVTVTALQVSGADEGRSHLELTGDENSFAPGFAQFVLPYGEYVFSAKRLSTANQAEVSVWPVATVLPEDHTSLPAYTGTIHNGDTPFPLTPEGLESAAGDPFVLGPGLGSQTITIPVELGATIVCTLLDENGEPLDPASHEQVFGMLPQGDASWPALFNAGSFPPGLERAIGYGVAPVVKNAEGNCSLPGAPKGTNVIESSPVTLDNGETVVYRTSTEVESSSGTVEVVAGPSPLLAFTYYFSDEPFGDARGPIDYGGLVTFGWMPEGPSDFDPTNTFTVSSGFRGLGQYQLEIWYVDPCAGSGTCSPSKPDLEVRMHCEAKSCKLLPSSPKAPAGTSASGAFISRKGAAEGTLVWKVPLAEVDVNEQIWFRLTTTGNASSRDTTAVLKATRKGGGGNSYIVASAP